MRVASTKKPAGIVAGGLFVDLADVWLLERATAVRRHDRLMMVVMTMMEVALHLKIP